MKRFLILSLLNLVGLASFGWASSAREDAVERLQKSADVLKEIMATPDKGIPEEVLDNAKCVLVVPNLVKGGFIIGAKHGRGVGSCRTKTGWSAPAFVSVGGGSAGLQIGVEGVDLIMLAEEHYDHDAATYLQQQTGLLRAVKTAVEEGALSATQFHPEKSGDAGAALLENWVRSLCR